MDPDPSMFLPAALSLLLLCGTVRCLQLLCALERNEEDEVIGYSDTFAGLLIVCAAQVLALVFCVWLLVRPCAWWVAALLAVLSLPVLLVTISFGFAAQHKLTAVEKPLLLLVGKVFTLPAKLLFRALHLSAASPMTEEDILELVDDAEEGDFIDESQKEMISAVFELDDLEAGEIMTHRTELEAMEDTTLAREVIAVALEKGFSRFPVYHKNLDDIVGILHVKDLLNLVKDPAGEAQPIKSYMRSVMFVPESCHAREL
ncbi:MAG: CBS domain-containing protein, partial [Pygmaiobacter sp.]